MRPQALARPSTREAHTTTHMRTSKSNIASRLDAQTHSQSDTAVCSPRQYYSGLKARLDLLLRLWQDTKEPRAVRQIAPVSLALQHGQATGHGPQGRHGRRAYRSDRARFGPDVPHPRRLLVPHHGDGQVGRLSDLLYRRRTRARRNTEKQKEGGRGATRDDNQRWLDGQRTAKKKDKDADENSFAILVYQLGI